VLWRTLVRDSADDLDSLPTPIEMDEYFRHRLCWKMALLLVQSRTDGLEDKLFWQNHATYEKICASGKLPSRSEISIEADDMARQMREAEVAFGEPFSVCITPGQGPGRGVTQTRRVGSGSDSNPTLGPRVDPRWTPGQIGKVTQKSIIIIILHCCSRKAIQNF
jgi:hypothetical protein